VVSVNSTIFLSISYEKGCTTRDSVRAVACDTNEGMSCYAKTIRGGLAHPFAFARVQNLHLRLRDGRVWRPESDRLASCRLRGWGLCGPYERRQCLAGDIECPVCRGFP